MNLVLSIWLVQVIGLPGIYIGTVISGLIANFVRPVIIYHVCFDRKTGGYFLDSVKYRIVMVVIIGICYELQKFTMPTVTILHFLVSGIMITVVFHVIFLGLFCRTEEFRYLWNIIKERVIHK